MLGNARSSDEARQRRQRSAQSGSPLDMPPPIAAISGPSVPIPLRLCSASCSTTATPRAGPASCPRLRWPCAPAGCRSSGNTCWTRTEPTPAGWRARTSICWSPPGGARADGGRIRRLDRPLRVPVGARPADGDREGFPRRAPPRRHCGGVSGAVASPPGSPYSSRAATPEARRRSHDRASSPTRGRHPAGPGRWAARSGGPWRVR